MILLDSNIVIYSRQAGYDKLRTKLISQDVAVSSITHIEVLGWHLIEPEDERVFREFFDQAVLFPLEDKIIDKVIVLKRNKPRMQLADAIIAGTAMVNNFELWTSNTADFKHIPDLRLINPLTSLTDKI